MAKSHSQLIGSEWDGGGHRGSSDGLRDDLQRGGGWDDQRWDGD